MGSERTVPGIHGIHCPGSVPEQILLTETGGPGAGNMAGGNATQGVPVEEGDGGDVAVARFAARESLLYFRVRVIEIGNGQKRGCLPVGG